LFSRLDAFRITDGDFPVRYAIVINMDYAHYPHSRMAALFRRICNVMKHHGFRLDGRIFTIAQSPEKAGTMARRALDEVDAGLGGESLYACLREFYGFELGAVSNLLRPDNAGLCVEEYDPAVVIEEIHLAAP
jgi:hypothetical protein